VGRGIGRTGQGVRRGSLEEALSRRTRSALRLSLGTAPAGSPPRQEWGGEQAELEEGRDWRREQEEGGRRGGRSDAGWVKVYFAEGWTSCTQPPRVAAYTLAPLPLFLSAAAPSQTRGARRLGSSELWKGCVQKRKD
jgi:hypothetical protein